MQTVMIAENIIERTGFEVLDRILEGMNVKAVHQPILSFPDGRILNYETLSGTSGKENKSRRSLYSTIGQLSKAGYCFSPDEKTENIYETMKLNPAITAFTVVKDGTATGFLTRTTLNETLGGRYGFTLYSRSPIRDIMKTSFLKVAYDTPIDQVSKLAMQRPFERLYDPIVVEQDGKYAGIVTVKDLLDTSTRIALAERDEIAVMKDSLKIGLFLMDRNYIIQDHYSRYLEEILSEADLLGKYFPELLSASVSAKDLDSIRDYFEMIFDRSYDQDMLDDINPLNELHYVSVQTGDRKVFRCEFTTIERSPGEVFILVTIYDITAKVKLEQQLLEEENRRQEEMKTVFELIQVDPQVFDDFLEDTEFEFERIDETLKNESMSVHEVLVEVYQAVHAVKSNAVILGLRTFGDKVHNLESRIKVLREQETVPFDAILNLATDIENLSKEKDGFKATIEKINSFKSANHGENRTRHVLVESLNKTVSKISGDLGKKMELLVESIDDAAVEKGPRRLIKEVLMQLIRNSAVHGIEMPEDRAAKGKNETGLIRLSINLTDGNINIKLKDDGCGINYGKIAEKALRLNLIQHEDAENKAVLLKTIFLPGFSTAETEGLHAGRGIGLSLVQDRLRAENGSIKVQTETDKGTAFSIVLPS